MRSMCQSPMSNVSADMLEQELYQEELQNSGVHITFGGPHGIPGERHEMAAYLMEAAHRAEATHCHIPRPHCSSSTASSSSMATCGVGQQTGSLSSSSSLTLVDAFSFGIPLLEIDPAIQIAPRFCRGSSESSCAAMPSRKPQDPVVSAWDDQVLTPCHPIPTRAANSVSRRPLTSSSMYLLQILM
jgi:hypothetical protein